MAPECTTPSLSAYIIKSAGLSGLSKDQIERAVYVDNIPSEQEASNFFSFCTNIEKIVQSMDPNNVEKHFAVIVFSNPEDYEAAFHVGDANIHGIRTYPYNQVCSIFDDTQNIEDSHTTDNIATEAISFIAASSFIKCQPVIDKVKTNILGQFDKIDQATHLSDNIKKLDEQYRILDAVDALGTTVRHSLQEIDEACGVSEKGTAVKQMVLDTNVGKNASTYFSWGWNFMLDALSDIQYKTGMKISQQRVSIRQDAKRTEQENQISEHLE
ncbi:hypothetical protein AKO1_014257 [Acrasis kona]|uniref:Uncharacterized protein n=1 Tax=Acrasis kona TaxID=1008807 RepID=A0AAW2Z182_9EUKA